jgi:uncharacterized protein (TIGR02452 family)
MSLKAVAADTVAITDRGGYQSPSGKRVDFSAALRAMYDGTILYTPEDLRALVASLAPPEPRAKTRIEVTGETTGAALARLIVDERCEDVLALNYASAKNPGGGFLGGAKAQEEDLARVSTLYASQITKRNYYDANRAEDSMLYTDHAIYSPSVVFFRDERHALLESPFVASIVTMPAPNAGEHFRRHPDDVTGVRDALERRIAYVLSIARAHHQRVLVLGAWGCGVFRNDPDLVATLFANALAHEQFAGAFERVVFAVYDRKEAVNRAPFEQRFVG